MISAVSIELEKVTGYVHHNFEKTLTVDDYGQEIWQKADELLRAWAWSVHSGCDDVDFTVTFADGYRYRGTIELQHSKEATTEKLSEHIREHCLVYSGRQCPSHIAESDYQKLLSMYKQETKNTLGSILDRYQIG